MADQQQRATKCGANVFLQTYGGNGDRQTGIETVGSRCESLWIIIYLQINRRRSNEECLLSSWPNWGILFFFSSGDPNGVGDLWLLCSRPSTINYCLRFFNAIKQWIIKSGLEFVLLFHFCLRILSQMIGECKWCKISVAFAIWRLYTKDKRKASEWRCCCSRSSSDNPRKKAT